MTLPELLPRLDGVKSSGNGQYTALCPCHTDNNASLSVSEKGGKILLHCFAGCEPSDIMESLGLTMQDLFNDKPTPTEAFQSGPATQEAEYIYRGTMKKVKFRKPDGSKFFTWYHKDGTAWVKGRGDKIPGLYQSCDPLPDVVLLVEGEKDVETLRPYAPSIGAVSLPDGSQTRWNGSFAQTLKGKQVIIFPDNDAPGMKYAQMCARNLKGYASSIKVFDLKTVWPDIPDKADITDLWNRRGPEAVSEAITAAMDAPEWEPEQDPFLSLFKPLDSFTEEEATWLVPGWIPEAQITLIAADGGVGKTTVWVDIIAALSSGRSCILDPPGFTRKPMKVAFCTTEDSIRKKLLKKLREAGANMKNIRAMDMAADKDGALKKFKFGSTEMEQFIKYFKFAACAFDPVQGFIPPEINMGSRNAMRDCMAPLITLGEDVGTTFLVICHTNKRKGAYGRDRIADSADLWDIARSVIMMGYTEAQGIRYLSNEKNNYAKLQETVLFSINDSGQIVREGTSWKRDREYMQESAAAKAPTTREDCKEFILKMLETAPDHCVKSDDLTARAQANGYSYHALREAKRELKKAGTTENYTIGSAKNGDRVWFIRLKPTAEETFQELPQETITPFDTPSA